MKTVILILLVLGILIAGLLVIGLFLKKDYVILRETTISKPKEVVYDYVKFLKNQNNFSVWAQMDPNMKTEFKGVDGTVGFVSAWSSENKNVGIGEQEIKGITPDRIDYEIRFIKPFPSVAPAYLEITQVSDKQTIVKWGFAGHMKYPTNLMLLFLNMEKMIGNDLSKGLANLKNILEE